MAKCLRCGAGNEWIEGNPTKRASDANTEDPDVASLIAELAALKQERDRLREQLREADENNLALSTHMLRQIGLAPEPTSPAAADAAKQKGE